MFKLCKNLKALKGSLKALNRQHFSHISTRVVAAKEDLLQAQQYLHDNLRDVSLWSQVADLRVKAFRLAEAEMSFCFQVAKAK